MIELAHRLSAWYEKLSGDHPWMGSWCVVFPTWLTGTFVAFYYIGIVISLFGAFVFQASKWLGLYAGPHVYGFVNFPVACGIVGIIAFAVLIFRLFTSSDHL